MPSRTERSNLIPLARVTVARHTLQEADEDYKEELERAFADGCSYVEIARAAGVSRQAIREYLMAHQTSTTDLTR